MRFVTGDVWMDASLIAVYFRNFPKDMAAYLPEDAQHFEDDHRQNRPARQQARQQPTVRNRSQQRPNQRRNDRRERPSYWQHACGLCQEDHPLSTCRRFLEMSPYQRYETVERRNYCRNCLARSHLAPDCSSLIGCHRCDNRHHTLLHGAAQLEDSLQQAPLTIPPFTWDLVLIPTAMVRIVADSIETWATVRALISQSAVMTKISYSSFRRLGLRSFRYKERRFTTFNIMARNPNNQWALKVNALISDELPYRPYSDPIIEDPTTDFAKTTLADIDPRSNTPIELELGADTFNAIKREGQRFAGIGDVYGHESKLGILFSGPIKNLPNSQA
ncbi:uncharacterized protein isoform X2 [Musca autumnalis]|uniref:uncharacterized protein isoform X2 n=1 Tax=Musca autumnalis TaxID=221902 RepID=UPI003CE9255B